jgi:hypothetical protein
MGGGIMPAIQVKFAKFAFGCALSLAAFTAVTVPAKAVDEATKKICFNDVKAHCMGAVSGGDVAVKSCLQENIAVVSAPCKKVLGL